MDFYEELDLLGLSSVLERPTYESVKLENTDLIYEAINDIRENNRKVLLYGDYDPDGLMCIMCWKEFFQIIRFKNYDIYKYSERTHLLDESAVQLAIEGKYEYIIINDTGSNELDKINKLLAFDVKIIMIDHHQTKFNYSDYPKGCSFVNSIVENRMHPERFPLRLSAGALVFVVLDYYITRRYNDAATDKMACFGLVSLYADSVDMSGEINRKIYYKAMRLKYENLPVPINLFMQSYSTFSRRFIEYHYTPNINCAFRNEIFNLINTYMELKSSDQLYRMSVNVRYLQELHKQDAIRVTTVTDIIEHEVLDNFVIANMNSVDNYVSVEDNKLYNYTGLVANRLAERYSKCAVVWCESPDGIKGSFRDLYSRDYLSVFKQFCDAGGHSSAFGMHINPLGFKSFIRYIRRIDKKFSLEPVANLPIIVEHTMIEPEDRLLADVARYNEFSGNQIPIALIAKRYTADIRECNTNYGYNYKWGSYYIKSSKRLHFGDRILCKPVLNKKISLYAL